MIRSPPLRFLLLAVGGWACARALVIVPPFWREAASAEEAAPLASAPSRDLPKPLADETPAALAQAAQPRLVATRHPTFAAFVPRPALPEMAIVAPLPAPPTTAPSAFVPLPFQAFARPTPLSSVSTPVRALASRWSASAWAFARRGGAAPLAGAGMLGGSQVGARFAYRLAGDPARPLSLSTRLYTPTGNRRANEATLGVEWAPLPNMPLRLLGERRQALGRDGRSAFALSAYGGVSEIGLPAGFRLEAYGQAGVVGARSRDLFAEGAAVAAIPVALSGRLRVGGGVWGAAQPGVSRLDVGPRVSLQLPVEGGSVVVAADWRLRAAGDARPASGPALTLSTAF